MEPQEEVDVAFAPIEGVVNEFAKAHSLRLDKCARGNVGWELTRSHPEGGNVFLLLLFNASLGLGVGSVWQFPCPEMSLLYSHFRPIHACAIEPFAVIRELESELQHLAKVRFGYWTQISALGELPQDAA